MASILPERHVHGRGRLDSHAGNGYQSVLEGDLAHMSLREVNWIGSSGLPYNPYGPYTIRHSIPCRTQYIAVRFSPDGRAPRGRRRTYILGQHDRYP